MDRDTWAIMGATGATGSSVLRYILDQNPGGAKVLQINILVRSRKKLLAQFPELVKDSSVSQRIHIIEGSSTDDSSVAECVRGAAVVFCCVGQNGSGYGTTLYSATAAALITALRFLRESQGPSRSSSPVVIQLRSASLNPLLAKQAPLPVRMLVHFCLHYSYKDLKLAGALLASAVLEKSDEGSPLLHYILVDPPTLHGDQRTIRTGYRLIKDEKQLTALSYADLGASMCDIAQRALDAEFRNEAVGVTAIGPVDTNYLTLARHLVDGALGRLGGMLAAAFPAIWTSNHI